MSEQLVTAYEIAGMAASYQANHDIPLDWNLDYSSKRLYLKTVVSISDLETCEFSFKYKLKSGKLSVTFKRSGVIEENEYVSFISHYIDKEKDKKQVRKTLDALFEATDSETLDDIKDHLYYILGTAHYNKMMKGVINNAS